jgi:hypothetical protein
MAIDNGFIGHMSSESGEKKESSSQQIRIYVKDGDGMMTVHAFPVKWPFCYHTKKETASAGAVPETKGRMVADPAQRRNWRRACTTKPGAALRVFFDRGS